MERKKLPISAIVAGHNDAKWIKDFLENISFCDEIIFVDLESEDNTLKIAKELGVTVFSHERVPIVEIIQYEFIDKVKHDWVLLIDPDERISPELKQDIYDLFDKGIPDNVGGVYGHIIYYMKKHQLKGTMWGGVSPRKLLSHKDRYTFQPIVHGGHALKNGFTKYQIPFKGENYVHHYWMTSYRQLFEKHWRYIKNDLRSKYNTNTKIGRQSIIISPIKAFRECFIMRKGYKDGFTGLFLSFFWAWYNLCIEIGLYKYQKKQKI